MAFVKFVGTGRSYAAKASLSRTGMLSFNDGAHKRFKMGDFTFIVLYYDEDSKQVGIELTNDQDAEGVRKIRHRSTGADVGIKSFVDFWELDIEKTTIYEIHRDPETNFLVIDLRNGRTRNTTGRGGKEDGQGELDGFTDSE